MEIKRDFYLKKLVDRMNNGLIKVVTGIRRCGKSYLLNTLFYHHLIESGVDEQHIIRFAFDSAEDLLKIGEDIVQLEKEGRGVDPKKFMGYISSCIVDDGRYYLLLDEIQRLDCFVAVLNGYLYNEKLDVYVTGSNAKLLSKDVATEFASTNRHLKMQEMLSRAFLISSRVTCRTDRMMMHRVQQQLEDNCKNKLGGLPVKNRQFS